MEARNLEAKKNINAARRALGLLKSDGSEFESFGHSFHNIIAHQLGSYLI